MALVLVHGGAGAWRLGPDRLREAVAACERAAAIGLRALETGRGAIDAVEDAVCILEDAPMLNAGVGSYPNTAGIVEMDALIMEGATLGLGAVAAVRRVRHPVSLARRVMTDTRHTLLVGDGASAFADSIGFPRCEHADLIVERPAAPPSDTVGAVAIDDAGNVAAATSTGGIPDKLPGRVGDSPLPGCGAYADNAAGAVSATGDGEALMKVVISKQVCDFIAAGMSADQACAEAIGLLVRRVPGAHGGLIAVDAHGGIGVACNTAAMPWACARPGVSMESGYAPMGSTSSPM